MSTRCYGCGEPNQTCECGDRWTVLSVVDPKHRQWLGQQITRMVNTHDFADNLRVARVGDLDAEQEYARRLERGCCGFLDTYVRHPDGTVFHVGLNWGH